MKIRIATESLDDEAVLFYYIKYYKKEKLTIL